MNRRNVFTLGLVFLLSISFVTGCWDRPFISSDTEGNRSSKELLGYLENDDADGLKSMLCVITRDSPTIDEEIQAAFDFFDGKVKSHNMVQTASQESVREGEIVFLSVRPSIKNIETDMEETYVIKFYDQVVNAENPEKVGISEIRITNEEGEECVVGKFIER